MPTVITPNSPAQSLSRSFNHMGQFWVKTIALSGSVLGDRQQSTRGGLMSDSCDTLANKALQLWIATKAVDD